MGERPTWCTPHCYDRITLHCAVQRSRSSGCSDGDCSDNMTEDSEALCRLLYPYLHCTTVNYTLHGYADSQFLSQFLCLRCLNCIEMEIQPRGGSVNRELKTFWWTGQDRAEQDRTEQNFHSWEKSMDTGMDSSVQCAYFNCFRCQRRLISHLTLWIIPYWFYTILFQYHHFC
jgi:hypothetical protein